MPFPGGRPFPGYKQSVTNRNAPTVSSSPPPSSERLCFFTSLSERLRMLLPPPTPFWPLNSFLPEGRRSLLPQAQGSRGQFPLPGGHHSPPPRGSGRPSQPRPAPLGQPGSRAPLFSRPGGALCAPPFGARPPCAGQGRRSVPARRATRAAPPDTLGEQRRFSLASRAGRRAAGRCGRPNGRRGPARPPPQGAKGGGG